MFGPLDRKERKIAVVEAIDHFLIAFLITVKVAGGTVFIPCSFAACSAILYISLSSVFTLVSNGHAIPMSLHLKLGIYYSVLENLSFP